MKKLVVTVLTIIFAMAVSGCGLQGGSGRLPTITMYPAAGNISSGVVRGYKGDYFASRGFRLDIWAYSDERTNAMLASGDLPDIMYIAPRNLDVMIEGGMLLNLDDHLDKMPHARSYKPLGTALHFTRQNRSAGTGKLYGLPTMVGDSSVKAAVSDSTERNAVKVKWDVYEQIGAPKPLNINGLLDIMERMLTASPRDAAGSPFYGTILNNGSDTLYWACMTLFYRWQGYSENQLPYLLETDMVSGRLNSIFEPDSVYYQGLKWYNEAYRRGLLDKDSINNDRPTQKVKVDAGYAMIPSGNLPGWAPGYYEIYVPGTNIYSSHRSIYGASTLIGINAKTKNLEACLAFLDMLCDPDAFLTILNGPDGNYWYSDGEGNAFFTEAGLKHLETAVMADSTGFALDSGEKLELWNTPWVVNSGAETSFMDGEGNPRMPYTQQWRENNEMKSQSESFKRWQAATGYDSWKDQLSANNAYYPESPLDGVFDFCSLPDDNMQLIISALQDTVVTASWKMVYAGSDRDFQSIWDKMISDSRGLGSQRVIDWRLADIQRSMATRNSLIEQ